MSVCQESESLRNNEECLNERINVYYENSNGSFVFFFGEEKLIKAHDRLFV